MVTPSTRFAGILALFVVFVLSGCSEDSMLVGPEASQKMSQTETLTVAPAAGINAFSLGKGADKVAVCHVPEGNEAHDAIYMEVGANAATAHLNNHAGDRQIAIGGSCDTSWASYFLAMPITPGQFWEDWCGGFQIYDFTRTGENEWQKGSTLYDLEGIVAHFEANYGTPPESCANSY